MRLVGNGDLKQGFVALLGKQLRKGKVLCLLFAADMRKKTEAGGSLRRAKLLALTAPHRSSAYLIAHRGRAVALCSVALLALTSYLVLEANSFVYEYSYHGRVLGVARSAEAVHTAVKQLDGVPLTEELLKELESSPVEITLEVSVGGGSSEETPVADVPVAAATAAGEAAEPVSGAEAEAALDAAAGGGSSAALPEADPAAEGASGAGEAAAETPAGPDLEAALKAIEAGLQITIDSNEDIEIKEIKKPVFTSIQVDTPEEIVQSLQAQQDIEVKAWSVSINGVQLGILPTEEDANALHEEVLAALLEMFPPEDPVNAPYKKAEIWEKYEVAETKAALNTLTTKEELFRQIMDGTRMLHLITTEDATYEAPIPYKTDFTESDTLYQDQEKITSPGKDGRKYVVGEIIRIDGKDTNERNEIEVTVLQEPVAAKALRGTKPTPQTISTGEYILPIKDKDVTSLYGQRWGRTHEGIDFGADVGTPVYAADTGKVTSSGYLAGFGLCVEIDHGEGVTTLYAHLSESFVEVGEKVEQGDVIAKSGNTGYSTGPHLHFGIYIMGESVNPAPYLPDLTLAPYYSSSTNSGG